MEMRSASNPPKATGLSNWRSLWYGLSVKVPLPMCTRPCASRTQKSWFGSLAW